MELTPEGLDKFEHIAQGVQESAERKGHKSGMIEANSDTILALIAAARELDEANKRGDYWKAQAEEYLDDVIALRAKLSMSQANNAAGNRCMDQLLGWKDGNYSGLDYVADLQAKLAKLEAEVREHKVDTINSAIGAGGICSNCHHYPGSPVPNHSVDCYIGKMIAELGGDDG